MEETEALLLWSLHFSGRSIKQINNNIVGTDEYCEKKKCKIKE